MLGQSIYHNILPQKVFDVQCFENSVRLAYVESNLFLRKTQTPLNPTFVQDQGLMLWSLFSLILTCHAFARKCMKLFNRLCILCKRYGLRSKLMGLHEKCFR